jgi:hypothetical protein
MKVLSKISENIEQINVKLAKLSESKKPIGEVKRGLKALDVMALLSLPDHLRKTATILCDLGKATADQVAKESGRVRAIESSYLNQLVVMGHVNKMRKGRRVYFYID